MLPIGAVLAPGQRTVTGILRVTGLLRGRRFVNRHRVLSRAAWCPRAASRLLLGLLVAAFAPSGPVVPGTDDAIERRRGKRVAAKGVHRDPVRSPHGRFAKASGLRWLGLVLLAPVPWAGRIWAPPFLAAPAPSERCCRTRGRRRKELTDRGRQLVLQARRRLPGRELVVAADSGLAALELLAAASRYDVACTARPRLDAAPYDPAPPRLPGTVGRPRTKGKRPATLSAAPADPATPWQRVTAPGWHGEGEGTVEVSTNTAVRRHREAIPRRDVSEADRGGMPVVPTRRVPVRDPLGKFDPQALLRTSPAQGPVQVLSRFVQRWQLEVAFREARDHLGAETQRQRPDKAIARTAPCLLGLFSLATLLGRQLTPQARRAAAASAWHRKQRPTLSDTLAAVRRELWREQGLVTSARTADTRKPRPAPRHATTYALRHAA